MKIYTCDPHCWDGLERSLCRDAGAFARAFRSLGIESKTIYLAPAQEGELSDELLRGTYAELCSPAWWKNLRLDGLLLYSGGQRKFLPIARAIHESGTFLIDYVDGSGLIFPWMSWTEGISLLASKCRFLKASRSSRSFLFLEKFFFLHAKALPSALIMRRFFSLCDLICFSSPVAESGYRGAPIYLSWKAKQNAIALAPPISSRFRYDNGQKGFVIMSVGRWEDEEPKRPEMLMNSIDAFFEKYRKKYVEARFDIYGTITDRIRKWWENLQEEDRERVRLVGLVPNAELKDRYCRARVLFCPSRHESTHLASAEAVCCGCSVVVSPRPALRVVQWFTSHGSGTIVAEDSPEAFADGVADELMRWKSGQRNPNEISSFWGDLLYVEKNARRILDIVQERTSRN